MSLVVTFLVTLLLNNITSFRSITMFSGIDITQQNIFHIQNECEEFCKILLVPLNDVIRCTIYMYIYITNPNISCNELLSWKIGVWIKDQFISDKL